MGKGSLEVFKFSLYLAIPVGALWMATDPLKMRRLLESTKYVVYPPEGPRPPTGSLSEVRAHASARQAEKAAQTAAAAPAEPRQPGDANGVVGRWLGWGGPRSTTA